MTPVDGKSPAAVPLHKVQDRLGLRGDVVFKITTTIAPDRWRLMVTFTHHGIQDYASLRGNVVLELLSVSHDQHLVLRRQLVLGVNAFNGAHELGAKTLMLKQRRNEGGYPFP